MAFPGSPTDGQTHAEGGVNYIFRSAANAWEIVGSSGVTNVGIGTVDATTVQVTSDTGTDATIPAATTTTAGVLSGADKTKLDSVEANAAADQNASEVPVTATGNLTSTDVQSALNELQGDIDTITTLNAADNFIATAAAPVAGDGVDGDFHLNTATGDITGPKAAGAWPATGNVGNAFATAPAATETAAGIMELATNAEAAAGTSTAHVVTPANLAGAVPALETDTALTQTTAPSVLQYADEAGVNNALDIRVPSGNALPANDAGERLFVLLGHATLPDGLYSYTGTAWFQV